MSFVRWGLLSTARINRKVIPSIRMSKRSQLVAVASRDIKKAIQYAGEWDIPRAFSSYDEMLTSDEVDAVYISLPNGLHAEWSIRALQAGKAVLCEKPFALTMDEVDRMIAASRESGKPLTEAFMYRHHPQTRLVKEWVSTGRIGDPFLVRGAFHFKLDDPEDIRLDPTQGGGSIWDIGVYPISYAQYIYGRAPQSVTGSQTVGPSGVDVVLTGQMSYSDGQSAQISSSFLSPFHMSVEIYGTEGLISIPNPFTGMEKTGFFYYTPPDGDPDKVNFPRKDLYLGEVEDIEDALLNGATPLVSLEETRDHIRTVLALLESAQTGKPASLPV
jgi:predicted dehydrogenase